MESVRSLRSVLDDLVGAGEGLGDAERALRAAGHQDLPPDLLGEAVASYAAVAPSAVAEHLAPFVTAWSAAAVDGDGSSGGADVELGLDLLGSASAVDAVDAVHDLDGLDGDLGEGPDGDLDGAVAGDLDHEATDHEATADLDFGAGGTPDAADVPAAGEDFGTPSEFAGLDLDPGAALDADLLEGPVAPAAEGPAAAPVDDADAADDDGPADGGGHADEPPSW